jgi:hypothetical protein
MTPSALPVRLSADGRTATWNPGLTRATQVVLTVHAAGGLEERRSMNSGRARVRDGERIASVAALDETSAADHAAEDLPGDLP